MNQKIENNMIRELTTDEVLAVSGGTQVCAYEVANTCYVWRDQTIAEWFVEQVYRAAGM